MLSVPVVAECELTKTIWEKENLLHREIRTDFEKLLAANAPLRVFVFNGRKGVGCSRKVAGFLCDRIGAMAIAAPYEVRYVLAAWEDCPRPAFRIFIAIGQGKILREIAP